jgi:hypothetical protein
MISDLSDFQLPHAREKEGLLAYPQGSKNCCLEQDAQIQKMRAELEAKESSPQIALNVQ